MPFTPLHYSIAYLIQKWKKEFSLPALIVGSMLPDLEKPFVYTITHGVHYRLILHSLFAAVTLGTFLTVLFTIFLYPPIASFLFKIDKRLLHEKCRFSGMLAFSSLLGCVSHILLDSLHHKFNPLFYPFLNESFNGLVLLGDWVSATIIVQSVILAITLAILVLEIRKGSKNFWRRILVG